MNPACRSCTSALHDTTASREKWRSLRDRKRQRLRRLRHLGRAPRIGLVGCGKAKREGVHAARDLYVGRLFTGAFALSHTEHDDTYILSARHGLLRPDDRVASYDFCLHDLRLSDRHRWGAGVVYHLQTLFPTSMRLEFVLLAGAAYVRPILDAARSARLSAWSFEDPMAGMGLLQRMSWLAGRHLRPNLSPPSSVSP